MILDTMRISDRAKCYLASLAAWMMFVGLQPALAADAIFGMPQVFSDGMVLQQEKPVPVWGWSVPGDKMRVRFAGQEKTATADAGGRWMVVLDPMKAGVKGELAVEGKERKQIKDVLVGEVWLCSGQSNMEFYASHLGEEAMKEAEFPDIRFFKVEKEATPERQQDVRGRWVHCSAKQIGLYSALGFLIAKDIHQRMGVPVGIIQPTQGNTRIESWMSLESLKSDPGFAPYVKSWETLQTKVHSMAESQEQVNQWKAAGGSKETEPVSPVKIPSSLFNGMVAPVAPYALRGIFWYQGESNAYQSGEYRKLFPVMIADWRAAWKEPKLPFLYVQLPNYKKREAEPQKVSPWAGLREAQAMALKVPDTEMAVTIDIGEEDIHPKNKPEVARRLMLVARAKVYGEKIAYTGPRFQKAEFKNDSATVCFDYTEGGLKTQDGAGIKGFALAGDDKVYHWAEAKIDGAKVVVRSDKVAKPVAVRYAWAENPECNLTNGSGLPAAPFRTDNW